MYKEFYGLRDIPFSLTPDPRFLYFTASHREVMANLHYGLQHGKGLIVATGEVGTGKTTMLRAMLARLDRSVLTCYIFNPGLTVSEFYHYIATSFGVAQYASKSDLLMKLGRLLMTRHARGLRSVLIVDEAQGLGQELLEEIRLLLNFETYTEKQLQIILAGQPELRQVLNDPALRQLKQRISLRCEIKPLRADEVPVYIRARLKTAGATRLDLFTAEAVALIHRASEGIPRLINNVCDNALLNGFAVGAKQITEKIVGEVVEELDLLRPSIEADETEALLGGLPTKSIMKDERGSEWQSFENSSRPRPRAADATPLRSVRPAQGQRQEAARVSPLPTHSVTPTEIIKTVTGAATGTETNGKTSPDFGVVTTEPENRV
jgi:type II secretory pathway predicted ATPase ExeA